MELDRSSQCMPCMQSQTVCLFLLINSVFFCLFFRVLILHPFLLCCVRKRRNALLTIDQPSRHPRLRLPSPDRRLRLEPIASAIDSGVITTKNASQRFSASRWSRQGDSMPTYQRRGGWISPRSLDARRWLAQGLTRMTGSRLHNVACLDLISWRGFPRPNKSLSLTSISEVRNPQ